MPQTQVAGRVGAEAGGPALTVAHCHRLQAAAWQVASFANPWERGPAEFALHPRMRSAWPLVHLSTHSDAASVCVRGLQGSWHPHTGSRDDSSVGQQRESDVGENILVKKSLSTAMPGLGAGRQAVHAQVARINAEGNNWAWA